MADDVPQSREAIARAALRVPVEHRDRYINERCGDDAEKRSGVERCMRRLIERELGGSDSTATASHSAYPECGEIINDEYEILEEIGRGGYGVVYRCRELSLGKIVAIKMLVQDVRHPDTLSQFLDEGRRLALLNHSNVVQVHRASTFDGRPLIVMEHLEGRTVRQLLKDSRALSPSRALNIMSQVARGLHEIHRHGLVHRDLSARNVMVNREDIAKILDLGLARFVDARDSLRSAMVRGTPPYLAPELFDGTPPSFASDIFALGVLTYEITTGVNPFQGPNTKAIVEKLLHYRPAPIDSLVPGLSPQLVRLVQDCLEKNPGNRPSVLEDVADRLLRSGQSTGPANPASSTSPGFLPNPYLNRAMIQSAGDFVGRIQYVRKIFARLNATPPGSISVVGDRRIGKSSLLNYVSMRSNRDAYLHDPDALVLILLDLQRKTHTLSSFLEELMAAVRQDLEGRARLLPLPHTLSGLRAMVEQLHRDGFRLVIMLDEFERITRNENFSLEFFSFLRSLVQPFNVGYITSSVRDLQDLCHTKEIAESPFFNVFTQMRLGAFSPEEARDLVINPARNLDLNVEPFCGFIFDELAGYLPMFIQIACSHIVEVSQDSPDTPPDLTAVRRGFEDEVEPHFRFLWESFNEAEQIAYCHVTSGRSVPKPYLHAQRVLETNGYVRNVDGRPKPFSKAFGRFVCAADARAECVPLWRRVAGLARRS